MYLELARFERYVTLASLQRGVAVGRPGQTTRFFEQWVWLRPSPAAKSNFQSKWRELLCITGYPHSSPFRVC